MAAILTPVRMALPIGTRTIESTETITGGGADVALTLATGSTAILLAVQSADVDGFILVRTTTGGTGNGIPLRLDVGTAGGHDRVLISVDWAEATPVTIEIQPDATADIELNIVEMF